MYQKMKDDYKITFIRGATTATGNSIREIEVAVVELIDELISRNNLIKTRHTFHYIHSDKRFKCMFPCFNCKEI